MMKVILLASIGVLLGSSLAGVELSNLHKIEPSDSPETILEKAAHVVPTARQAAYLDREFIGFIHFGPNTFTGKEWGNGMEDPATFAPEEVDTDQWCETMKAAGIEVVVMTFKHHDGYVLWPSRYEDHQTIRNSPYRNGQGDIARMLSESCRKHGLGFGVYLSPADLYQIESKVGLYGNGSRYRASVIPTDPASFKSDPTRVRGDRPDGAPVFEFECDDYNRYMLNQLYEMLTEYGPVCEVWFDGAHPKRKGGQTYTYGAWYELIRTLAPEAVIFGKGPDVRWCGNEAGGTRESEWNVVPLPVHPDESEWNDNTPQDIGSRAKLMDAKYLYYRPAETNTSIRNGWFWRNDDEQQVRTPDDVFDIYERATGGNSVFMLNVPPNRDGRFSEEDRKCLIEVGRRIRETYGSSLSKGGVAPELEDGDAGTGRMLSGRTGEVVVELPEATLVNRFVVRESITRHGERIERHALDAWIDGEWREVAAATNVGHKRILRFPAVTTDKLRLRVLESRAEPGIAEVSAHFYRQPPLPVKASADADGTVSLSLDEPSFRGKGGGFRTTGLEIRYTLDGSDPDRRSPAYGSPIPLADGGLVKARAFSAEAEGPVAGFRFGPAKKGWKVTATSEESAKFGAAMAIDGDPATFWHSRWSAPAPDHPHGLEVDLGRSFKLTGITYLPRQDRRVPDSMIERGRIEVSVDGTGWTKVGDFEFGNLLNDPSQRNFRFSEPHEARHIRLISTAGAQGKPYAGAAEFGVLVD